MLWSNTRLAVKPSKFDHDEINIHSSATQHYGRHTALRGMLAALGFTPLFTRVERLSAGLALTGGASAAGMGAAGTGPTGIGTALGFTPLFSRVERLSLTLTGGASAAWMGAAAMRAAGMGAGRGMGAAGGKPTVAGRPSQNSPRSGYCGLAWAGVSRVGGSSAAAASGALAGNRLSLLRVRSCPPENGLTPYTCMPG